MKKDIKKLSKEEFPLQLFEIPQPPKKLFLRGVLPSKDSVLLTVVGSRKYSNYGKDVCEKLISGLSGNNITIVSGLAIGIDTIAHTIALKARLKTIAVPGSGLDEKVLYPRTNHLLAEKIVENGGALISEFEPDFRATPWSFPQRNRIMAGLSRAILVIEAEQKSGTLITARMAVDYNRDVLAVPGSISSITSRGTNLLIRQGATPITSSDDILESLGFETNNPPPKQKQLEFENCSHVEKRVLNILHRDPLTRDELIRALNLSATESNILFCAMELKGLIKESGGKIHPV